MCNVLDVTTQSEYVFYKCCLIANVSPKNPFFSPHFIWSIAHAAMQTKEPLKKRKSQLFGADKNGLNGQALM
jgi:hypothetical protein